MLQPGLTIGIPTYNRASALKETVLEALAFSTPKVQVLVVDDGSTDETPQVLREIRTLGRPIKTVTHVSNQGLAGSLSSMVNESETTHLLLFEDDGVLEVRNFTDALEFVERVQPALLGTELELSDGVTFSRIDPREFGGAHHAPGWIMSVADVRHFLPIFEKRRANKCEFVQIYPQKFFATALIAFSDNCWSSTLCLVKESRNYPQQLKSTEGKQIDNLKTQIFMYFDFFVVCDMLKFFCSDPTFKGRILLMEKVWRKEGNFRFFPGRWFNLVFFTIVRLLRLRRLGS